MIYEPGGYHPYKTTISLRLRESERVARGVVRYEYNVSWTVTREPSPR